MATQHGSALTARARARKQQLQPKKKTVKLSAQARKELTAEQRIKRAAFNADVSEIWNYCQTACKNLGVKHKKPLRKCLDAVYLGAKAMSKTHKKTSPWTAYVAAKVKDINSARQPGETKVNALNVSRTHGEDYRNTSAATIQQYVEALEESKADKSAGQRVGSKSKVMDIYHTFEGIKSTLANLDARVGIRAIVVLVRSTSDFNQDPLSYFSDESTAAFLPKVYGIDMQDMLTRFEGYSVAGGTLAGMATTYKERVQAAKSELSTKLRQGLRLITGKPKIKMLYKSFFRDITIKHRVALRNWPHRELVSPGSMGNSLPAICKLLDLVTSGDVYFEVLDADELQQMEEEEDAKIVSGEVVVSVRRKRKDAGTGRQGYGRGRHEDDSESGSESDGPPAKKARTSATSTHKKSTHRSASLVVDSGSE